MILGQISAVPQVHDVQSIFTVWTLMVIIHLLIVLSIVRNNSLWYNVVFEKEAIIY